MSKTAETVKLEQSIYRKTKKMGVFGCFEVTIGWFGRERVDYLTYDTKGRWRCYEIKVSLSDFHSNSNNTFVGHYNYYVMPQGLYNQVKDEIPKNIGVYTESNYCVKKARKQVLAVDEQVLKNSMIRSLSREADYKYRGESPRTVENLKRQISRLERERDRYRNR